MRQPSAEKSSPSATAAIADPAPSEQRSKKVASVQPKRASKRAAKGPTAKASATKASATKAPAAKAPAAKRKAKAPAPAPEKEKKQKLVRDSFTMPKADFALIGVLKERAIGFRRPAKKTELLRAGLHVLAAQSDASLRKALDSLTPLAPGRPKNENKGK